MHPFYDTLFWFSLLHALALYSVSPLGGYYDEINTSRYNLVIRADNPNASSTEAK